MRNAEPLALVGELVIARILWNRGKHRPHQYRQQDRGEADGVSTGKGSPEVRKRWLDDLFHLAYVPVRRAFAQTSVHRKPDSESGALRCGATTTWFLSRKSHAAPSRELGLPSSSRHPISGQRRL